MFYNVYGRILLFFVSLRPQYFGKACKGSSRGHFRLCNTEVCHALFSSISRGININYQMPVLFMF